SQKARASRRTNRCAGIVIGETHSLRGEPVEMRSPVIVGPVAAKIAITQIVGENEDGVGARSRLRQRRGGSRQKLPACETHGIEASSTSGLSGSTGNHTAAAMAYTTNHQ